MMLSSSPVRVVLCYPAAQQHLAQIEQALADSSVEAVVVDAGQDRIAEEILAADIYCGHAKKFPVPWGEVVRQGRLKWIQSSAAGMDHCLAPEVIDSDIVVSSASGVLANQVADHTLALLLGLLRSLPTFFRAQQVREFIRRPTRDLHHARIGIVGFGGNGRRLAEVLEPFQVELLATDCFPVDPPPGVELLPEDALDEMLPRVDILLLAAPLNDVTRGMIDARRLALLPEGALLVNMARGPLVVEDDLVDALDAGHLAGAALDVTEVEPLPEKSRLWNHPAVIITPHVGGQSARRIDDMTDFFCDNLTRFFGGKPLRNRVAEKWRGFPLPEDAAWRIR